MSTYQSLRVGSSRPPGPPTGSTCPPAPVRTYIADGKLRGYKIGRLIKVDVKELDAPVAFQDIRHPGRRHRGHVDVPPPATRLGEQLTTDTVCRLGVRSGPVGGIPDRAKLVVLHSVSISNRVACAISGPFGHGIPKKIGHQ